MNISSYSGLNRGAFGWPGYQRQAWQWQPTIDTHDPNPPITLEDGAAPATFNAAFAGASYVAGVVCA